MQKLNPEKKGEKDYGNIHTSPSEILAISSYLYVLDSYGVQGDVLECGCCYGHSSCCLSLVCNYLGRKLIVADSFAGLPDSESAYYKKGDFAAPFEEVRSHIETFGKISSVEFVKGFYSESLKGFSKPLCAIWMDVDLCQSAFDVLENTYAMLSKNGLLFSHEMGAAFFVNNALRKDTGNHELPKAFKKFFIENDFPLSGCFLDGNTAVFTVSRTPLFPHRAVSVVISRNHNNIDNMINKILLFARNAEVNNKIIVVWGAGQGGIKAFELLEHYGVEIHAFIDNAPEKNGASIRRLSVFPPEILTTDPSWNHSHCVVLIASMAHDSISKSLEMAGWCEEREYFIIPQNILNQTFFPVIR